MPVLCGINSDKAHLMAAQCRLVTVDLYLCICVCVFVFVYLCLCICICVFVYLCMCICICIGINSDKAHLMAAQCRSVTVDQ